jgi:cobalt-zinc-cadmium resistance protein CzcA
VKGSLAVKLSGFDLKTLEETAEQIVSAMRAVPGVEDLGIFRVTGQPTVKITVDRAAAERFGINVADIQDVVETALGGKEVSQVLQGEQRFDLVLRYQEPFRRTVEDIARIRLRAPSGERVSLGQLAMIGVEDGASMIYRESNQRYLAIKYSVRGRDLGSTVREAMGAVEREVELPHGYRLDWTGEYESQQRAAARLAVVIPLTLLLVTVILYSAFSSFKWAAVILATVALAPLSGMLALLLTGTHFSVSSGLGFVVLCGICVQTGVIMLEHINRLRAGGLAPLEAALQGGVEGMRTVTMIMLVAMLGLLPASLSHAIGSDSQRPFAIVIVGGLVGALVINVFLLPVLAAVTARPGDRLPEV